MMSNEDTVEVLIEAWKLMVGRLPGAFLHPRLGYVDALVMWREL